MRPLYQPGSTTLTCGYALDYMLKDHLGNIRMVLTDEFKQDVYPMASFENGDAIVLEREDPKKPDVKAWDFVLSISSQ